MWWANVILLFLNSIVLAVGVAYFSTRGIAVSWVSWTAPELVTVLLTALSTILVALTIFLAILAVWGYNRLAEEARSMARAATDDYLGRAVPLLLQRELDRRAGPRPNYGDAAAAAQEDEGDEPGSAR